MEVLAERMNFDPLIAENWYSIDKKEAFSNNKVEMSPTYN